ncbi:nuclear transport factor 2 family protein [Desulfosporosinus shakirovi]|uniref:nuclear transport factor 2 family protein n=1 Tax=Desulfosporosinus shakirovi TaxID=2885154 RepID=UPI001E60414D|nr:DUF4440 domain-containing protein [Desulfosporosinus sp. SRJS8]MCB8817369.1 DUF4440 domain-containing protein [Desulfosporosinus sp. SRJS8]
MDAIAKHILQLENSLLTSEIRKSPQKIAGLLVDDFIEFTGSGSEYHYKNGDVFQEQNDNSDLDWEIINFKIRELATDCILAMYKVDKHSDLDERKKYSLRSSIWKRYDSKWKIVFHQGTPSLSP